MKVLITGIAGRMGRLLAARLLQRGHEVQGIDVRAWHTAPEGVVVHQSDIRKRAAEDVFRRFRPEGVVHLATVTHIGERSSADRYRVNLEGTRAAFDHSHTYGASRAVFVGRHTYYGAAPDAPLYHREDEPPTQRRPFPELSDLVAADLYAGSALWRYPELNTSVLRVCYTLGPSRHGTLASFLAGGRVPTVLGFDPLFQLMHESDVALAIACALERDVRGVFNVAGPSPLPLSVVVRLAGRQRLPIPEPLFLFALRRLGVSLPPGAVDHLKYGIIVDDSAFRAATGYAPEHGTEATLKDFKAAVRLD